jgi:hypothetical protein
MDAPGKDGNASMPEEVKRHNPWRKMMIMTCLVDQPLQDSGIFIAHYQEAFTVYVQQLVRVIHLG